VVELAGLGVLVVSGIYGVLWWKAAGAFMLLSFVMGILMNILTVLLEEVALGRYPRLGQLSKLILAGSVEGFGYRQLHCYWRLRGFFQFLRGENIWGRMERKGLERT